ncbi:MAG: DUF4142 domain-containing protein [Gemmatimonadaceae bacterium]
MPKITRPATVAALAAFLTLTAQSAAAQSGAAAPAKPDAATQAPAQGEAKAGKLDDPTIVAIFDAANTWDMETGALAARKAKSPDVKKFGRMLVRDHRQVRGQGRALAKKLKVHPTPPGKDFALAKDHADAMKRLRAAKRADFDKVFLEHEVSYHKAVIDAVTTQLLPATQNQEVKDLETKVAPAFQSHMQQAQALLDKQK